MGGAALMVAEKREAEGRGSRWVRNLLGLHQGAMGIVQNLQPLPTAGEEGVQRRAGVLLDASSLVRLRLPPLPRRTHLLG